VGKIPQCGFGSLERSVEMLFHVCLYHKVLLIMFRQMSWRGDAPARIKVEAPPVTGGEHARAITAPRKSLASVGRGASHRCAIKVWGQRRLRGEPQVSDQRAVSHNKGRSRG